VTPYLYILKQYKQQTPCAPSQGLKKEGRREKR